MCILEGHSITAPVSGTHVLAIQGPPTALGRSSCCQRASAHDLPLVALTVADFIARVYRFADLSPSVQQALSLSKGAPPTTANDKHYQCYTTWPRNDEYGYLGYRSQLEPVR